ncbi:hypothetical protein JK222_08695 [Gluconobacter cerinus]|uniref:hypothetical protein n=1 Tax=Gluconobacter cerinus TaxID=38307 RepID=UPI001B8C6C77|nr:hypothetical protein [Gluconobacter cerinus]MBS1071779.1 hypothetical protein [Gluconobacter cerinus]
MTEENFTPTISARNVSGEVGVRITPTHHLNAQAAAFITDFVSWFSYDGDAGRNVFPACQSSGRGRGTIPLSGLSSTRISPLRGRIIGR